jgi:hypothetical protein
MVSTQGINDFLGHDQSLPKTDTALDDLRQIVPRITCADTITLRLPVQWASRTHVEEKC